VDFEAPAAVALREAMSAEMRLRYWHRFVAGQGLPPGMEVTADEVLWTGVALEDDAFPVGHVSLRPCTRGGYVSPETVELKRMYVVPSHRGAGVAGALLRATEAAAGGLGATRIVLQTGDRQPDAVRLYRAAGFRPVPVFPPYEALSHSRCFAKDVAVIGDRPRG
jgi:GNAT superfamily N-acetyltransferase